MFTWNQVFELKQEWKLTQWKWKETSNVSDLNGNLNIILG